MPTVNPVHQSVDDPFVPWVVLSRDPLGTRLRTGPELRMLMAYHGYSMSEISKAIGCLREAQGKMMTLLLRRSVEEAPIADVKPTGALAMAEECPSKCRGSGVVVPGHGSRWQ